MQIMYFSEEKTCHSGSHPGLILPTRGHWAVSGDIFGCHY